MMAGALARSLPANAAACTTPAAKMAAVDFSWLDARLAQRVARGYFDGMTLLIGRREQILHQACFGNGEIGRALHVASTGKWVAAATIAAVVDHGQLAWSDTAQSLLPELGGDKGRATLRQLLSHTAGYPDYQPAGSRRDDYPTLEQSVAHLRDLPSAAMPGVEFHYGGLSMQVAGRMAEVATGMAFNEIFLARIAAPLGMTSSSFTPVSTEPGFSPMLGGSMLTSAADYARFLMMFSRAGWYRGTRVLSAASVAELCCDQVGTARVAPGEFVAAARQDLRHDVYGLGMWREECDTQGKAALVSSPGWAGAYAWHDTKADLWGVVIAKANIACAAADGYNTFLGSAIYAPMARAAVLEARCCEIKRGYVAVTDGRLYYEESGEGVPVVFIHGHSFDRRQWNEQVCALQGRYRVVRFDLRGYGRSSMPDEQQRALHAEDLLQLLDALGLAQAHLIGLSLGGFVVTDFIALYPQRALSAVMAGGDLFDVPGPDQPWTADQIALRRTEIAGVKKAGISLYKQQWLMQLLDSAGSCRERLRQPLWRMIDEWQMWQPLHLEPRFLLGRSVGVRLATVKSNLPVLIIRGDRETVGWEIMDLLPQAKRHIIHDCGHVSNMERPDLFTAVLEDWLSGDTVMPPVSAISADAHTRELRA